MDPISEPVFILFYRLNSTNIEIDLKTKLSLNLMQKIHTNIWIRYNTILFLFSMETNKNITTRIVYTLLTIYCICLSKPFLCF